jgi:hypothetical protein
LEKWVLSYFLPVFFSIMFITGMFLFHRLFLTLGIFRFQHLLTTCAFALCLFTSLC